MPIELVPGAVVADSYRLDRRQGEGGMGVVWAAIHVESGRRVALKLLRPDMAADAPTQRRFLREARAAAAVRHPSVVAIHDVLELEDGTPILVMDLLEGESLREKLNREGRIPLPELSRILLPVVSAVGTAHALGIVHRDLKPDNVFLVDPGDDGPRAMEARVRVLDFGIAKLTATDGEAAGTSALTDAGALLGTPYYMSPEQVLGAEDIDHRADIWSIGVIVYECLTGIRPTEGDSVGKVLKRILTGAIVPLREAAPDTPDDVAALLDRMLTADRDLRPPDLREVGDLLERYGAITFRPFGPPASRPSSEAGPRRESPSARAFAAVTPQVDMGGLFPTLREGGGAGGGPEAVSTAAAKAAGAPEGELAASPRPPLGARRWVIAVIAIVASVAALALAWRLLRPAATSPPLAPAAAPLVG